MSCYRQRGQALVLGIFVVFASLLALFYLFNVGQLTGERVKLVNTADAVAYSAGLLEARGMNFDAYQNRALIANEVTIAQMVSLSSWAQYASEIGVYLPLQFLAPYCYEPFFGGMVRTLALCEMLRFAGWVYVDAADYIRAAAEAVAEVSEVVKLTIKLSQETMRGALPAARLALMDQVAAENYKGYGSVRVEAIPLENTLASMTRRYVKDGNNGDERGRLGELAKTAAANDRFVRSRSWTDPSPWPSCFGSGGFAYNELQRRGGTEMVGYDEWRATDAMSMHRKYLGKGFTCKDAVAPVGAGSQSAANQESGADADSDSWAYSGIADFDELTDAALKDPDPRARFPVRLIRDKAQTRTSETSSPIKASGDLAVYKAQEANDVIAATSTAEVFFQRPAPRADGMQELGSLFNPFWQVHLVANSGPVRTYATGRQGAAPLPE